MRIAVLKSFFSVASISALVLASAIAGCKPRTQGSRAYNEGAAGKCAAEEKLVMDLQKELQTATVATSPGLNADGQEACKKVSGSFWNTAIGRCECTTDPTKFSANAWSIRNTLKCEANTDGFKACKEVAGSRWNTEIGRCECVADPTKFQANAWSIKNHLKCEANTDGVAACKAVSGAQWNTTIGRCECVNDPTNFQANAWSIRTHLKCKQNTPICEYSGSFNASLGECTCSDGTAYSSYKGIPCVPGDTAGGTSGSNSSSGSSSVGNASLTGETGETSGTAGMFLARTIEEIQADLQKASAALSACKSGNTAPPQTDGCAAAGGTLDAEKTCRCSNGTPVYKLRNETCAQHLAKQNDTGTQNTGGTDTGNTDSTSASSCRCGWDSTYRLCIVWKDRQPLYPRIGPVSRRDWNCGDNSANDLCRRQTLAAVMSGQQCK